MLYRTLLSALWAIVPRLTPDSEVTNFRNRTAGEENVTWCRKNMMIEGDGAPIGILLCTWEDLDKRNASHQDRHYGSDEVLSGDLY